MIKVYVTSAFCKDNSGGNRAGVVLDYPELTVSDKMEISRRLGYSETAFVTKTQRADYKLEYYTPTKEVPLCGHATIATFATLKALNMLTGNSFTIETKAGILEITVEDDGLVMMQQNEPRYFDIVDIDQITNFMNARCVCEDIPSQIVSTGLKDVMLPIRSRADLDAMQPDMKGMTEFSRAWDVVGVHAFTLDTGSGEIDAVCRNFAPLYGIDEESATGTSNCALASYLFKYVRKKNIYVFEQGYSMGLPSRITVWLEYEDDSINKTYVGGYGYLVETKEI